MLEAKIGIKCIITNIGRTYTSFDHMAELLNLNNFTKLYLPKRYMIGTIINKNKFYFGIRLLNNNEIIMDRAGFEVLL